MKILIEKEHFMAIEKEQIRQIIADNSLTISGKLWYDLFQGQSMQMIASLEF